MIDDHRGVVSGDGATAVRAERLAVLLDTEILPCLERPSRLLGPFDGVFRSVGRTPDVAFIWPSLAEGPDTPEALRPLLASALLPPEMQLGLACAPAPDVERALRSHAIPWFARPALCPLADAPQWVVWLESPLQLLGLLSVFVAAGVQPRASRRAAGAPRVFISGPAADRVRDVAGVYADAVITPDVVARHLSDLASPGASSGASTDPGVFPGGLEAPSGPDLVGSHDEAAPAVHAARGSQAPGSWPINSTVCELRPTYVTRDAGTRTRAPCGSARPLRICVSDSG